MKKIIFLALLALITFGCRTVKQTSQTKTDVKTAANLNIKQSNESKLNIDSTSERKQNQSGIIKIIENDSVDETIDDVSITTNFSNPDSTGKQYPTSTTTDKKTIHRGEKKNHNTNEENKSNIDSQSKVSDKSDFKTAASLIDKGKTDSSQKTNDKVTEETKTPAWVYVVVLVLISGLLLGLYTILKRNGIIK
jgi:Tfp pilus assembly protein PilV